MRGDLTGMCSSLCMVPAHRRTQPKKKGREPNAPPSEAPRSARVGKCAKPRPVGRWLSAAPTLEIRGFQMGRSRAALNGFQLFSTTSFFTEPEEEYPRCIQSSKLGCPATLRLIGFPFSRAACHRTCRKRAGKPPRTWLDKSRARTQAATCPTIPRCRAAPLPASAAACANPTPALWP